MKKRILSLLLAAVMFVSLLSLPAFSVNAGEHDSETEIIVVPGAEATIGDANGDGNIDTADATAILRYIIRVGEIVEANSDCNGDGNIDTADATAILRYIIREYTFPTYRNI